MSVSLIHDQYTPIFMNCFPFNQICSGNEQPSCHVNSVYANGGLFVQSFAVLSDNSMFVVATRQPRPTKPDETNYTSPLVGGALFYTTTFFNDSNPTQFNLPLACPTTSSTGLIYCCAWNPMITGDGDTILALLLDDMMTIQFYSVRTLLTQGLLPGPPFPIYPVATAVVSNLGWSSICFDQKNRLYGVVPSAVSGTAGSILYRIDGINQTLIGATRGTPVPVCSFSVNTPDYPDIYLPPNTTVFCNNTDLPNIGGTSVTPFDVVSEFGPFSIAFTQVCFAPDGNLYLVGSYPFYNLWNRTPCCSLTVGATNLQKLSVASPASPCYFSASQNSINQSGDVPWAVSKYNGVYAVFGGLSESVLSGSPGISSLPPVQPAWVAPNRYSLRNSSFGLLNYSLIPQWISASLTNAVMLTTTLSFALLT